MWAPKFLLWTVVTVLVRKKHTLPSSQVSAYKVPTDQIRKEVLWTRYGGRKFRNKRDENERSPGAYGRGVGFYVGEPCVTSCNRILYNVYCNSTTGRCECDRDFPVNIENKRCVKGVPLGSACDHSESCEAITALSICIANICQCKPGYHEVKEDTGNSTCQSGLRKGFSSNSDMTTMISVIAGLIMFTVLFCLVLRLFSKQQFDQPQRPVEVRGDGGGQAGTGGLSVVVAGIEQVPRRASVATCGRYSRSSFGSTDLPPGSRRASYGMLAPPSNAGSRRASSASVRSQSSLRSYSSFRSQASTQSCRDPVRRTSSTPAENQFPPGIPHGIGRHSPKGLATTVPKLVKF